MTTIKARIVTPTGIVDGAVCVEAGTVRRVGPAGTEADHDFGDALIVPGFIDVHLHGLGRYGMFEVDDLLGAAALQVRYGTTGFLPTVASLTEDQFIRFGRNVREARAAAPPLSAEIIGAHFEGPFINPIRKGGMKAERLRPMDPGECRRYVDDVGDVMKLMTLSPELDGSAEVIALLRANGTVVSLGHSDATREQFEAAVEAGLSHVCHLFNTFDRATAAHRGIWPSTLITAILANDAVTCELICDMHHVPPDTVKITARALAPGRFVAMTDSMRGAGLPPGDYRTTDGRPYTTRDGVGTTMEDHVILGSVLTMNRAFGNLVTRAGVDPVLAARCTATNPARALGMDDLRGSIEPGKRADMAVLDAEFDCVATFLGGEVAYVREGGGQ